MNLTPTAPPVGSATRHRFRTPLARRLGLLFGTTFIGATTAVVIGFAVAAFMTMGWTLGLLMSALAALMVALTVYVWRDLRGNWGLRVELDNDGMKLDLPAGRSLIHRPPALHLTIPYSDIAAVDTRLEAYGSLGMAIMQRSYALHRKSGALIFLFEDRALGTAFKSSQFEDIVADLMARTGLKLHDLGMVEGRGGVLAAWGTHAPDWAAPSLSPARQDRLWRRAIGTGNAAIVATVATTSAWYGGLLVTKRPPEPRPPSAPQ